MLTELFQGTDWVRAVFAVATVATVAYALSEIASRVVRSVLVAAVRDNTVTFRSPLVRRPSRVVRATVFIAAAAALSLPALDLIGVEMPLPMSSTVFGVWLFSSGLRIAVIGVITYVIIRIIGVATRGLEHEISQRSSPNMAEQLKRARTLGGLVKNFLTFGVVALAALTTLRELNIDIMPILTGAGIVGLAVGFGAQTLVKDLISGFFLTLEDQVRVGDVVRIAGTGGLVEAINLRTVVLRDGEGAVHVFPNGSIDRLTNLTKDFSYAVLNIGVSYTQNVDKVIEVLGEIGRNLAADPAFAPNILAPLEIPGVEDLGESQIKIQIRIKTIPTKQWDVGRELRRRIKQTFDAHHIEFPVPQFSVYVGEGGKPLRAKQGGSVQPS
jgi:small conductance mechanosensitive channel